MKSGENMSNNRFVTGGKLYRHFKGGKYMVIGIARHTESRERLVIYYRVDVPNERLYARPLTMFLSEVDRGKYPEAKQRYRFEEIK